ncbi:endonuclease V [Thermofilum pendens]|uniref:Endonuclease V n=1 Tax=Thermofilum pendens (strain DSM 2475 / Hrk 5) TaxID=368408 RepID=NFI_THEPD|nr:endonuclease V [Thermofilum pendens]A1RY04.1 RecName: Full=Endonuclease V; AltName: Full=Deoxyinosine 3'endonuclease; AltName: Full=Deoxyribonuclease V; Short=DNase V [Thermofilum pendens Hrk 5]ABL78084.1 Endonuclease V [Thermofilum pendens Hrk 5]
MRVHRLPENFSLERARRAQLAIARMVLEEDSLPESVRRAAGVDVAFKGDYAFAAAVVVEYPSFSVVDYSVTRTEVRFPYVPTLLAFREVWPAYTALKRLKSEPDVLLVDGNGRLHPFKAGFACHLGVLVDKPTIGVAKKLLVGEVGSWKSGVAPVLYRGEVLGMAVKTSERSKPVFVSIGHKISLNTAVWIVRMFTKRGLRLPEPLRLAHLYATAYARGNMEEKDFYLDEPS